MTTSASCFLSSHLNTLSLSSNKPSALCPACELVTAVTHCVSSWQASILDRSRAEFIFQRRRACTRFPRDQMNSVISDAPAGCYFHLINVISVSLSSHQSIIFSSLYSFLPPCLSLYILLRKPTSNIFLAIHNWKNALFYFLSCMCS